MSKLQFKSAFFPDANINAIAKAIERKIPPELAVSKTPRILSAKDVVWAGEKMLELTVNYSSATLPPILVYFPPGAGARPYFLLQSLLGMYGMACAAGVRVPRLLGANTRAWGKSGLTEYAMIVKLPHGEPLDKIWPTLNKKQRKAIANELACVMLDLYRHDIKKICTTRMIPSTHKPYLDNSKLTISPLHQGPLESVMPQDQQTSVTEHLQVLSRRVLAALEYSNTSSSNPESFGWPGTPIPTEYEKAKIINTWNKLYFLAPFHVGGFYLPKDLSPEALDHACKTLRQNKTGIHHDLDISRIMVNFDQSGKPKITIASGWEHAYHAPHWSVARMPAWLVPGTPDPRKLPITRAQQLEMTRTIYNYMRKESPEWIICYTFAESERFFEGCCKSHWSCHEAVDAGIQILKKRWEGASAFQSGWPFPLCEANGVCYGVDPRWYPSLGNGNGSINNQKKASQVAGGSGAAAARATGADKRDKAVDSSGPTRDINIQEEAPQPEPEPEPETKTKTEVQTQVNPSTSTLEEQLAEAILSPSGSSPASSIPEIFEAPETTGNSSSSDAQSPSCVSPPTPTPDSEDPSSSQKQKEHEVAVGGWFGTIAKKFFLKRPQGLRAPSLFRHRGSSKPRDM